MNVNQPIKPRMEVLMDRALLLIATEWGWPADKARTYLEDDSHWQKKEGAPVFHHEHPMAQRWFDRWAAAAEKLPQNPRAGSFDESDGFRFYAAQRKDGATGEVFVQWELMGSDGTATGIAFGRWPV